MGAQIRGDLATCRAIGDEVMEFNKAHTVRQFNVISIVAGGWAHYVSGDEASGRELIAIGQRLLREGRLTSMMSPFVQVLLADIEARTGDAQAALARLRSSLPTDGTPRYFDAEVTRRIGELTLQISPEQSDNAAHDFRTAIAIARRQGAHALELRAAVALARLLVRRGQREAARLVLQPLLAAFPADAALPELPEALALLVDSR